MLLDHDGKTLNTAVDFFSKYELVLKEGEFQEPLVKDKNFHIGVFLIDIISKKVVDNLKPIPVKLKLYTYNNPPTIYESNYMKGNLSSQIIRGVCSFRKIHIKYVTSHLK